MKLKSLKSKGLLYSISGIGASLALVLSFQNCSGFGTQLVKTASLNQLDQSSTVSINGAQSFAAITAATSTGFYSIANAQAGGYGYAYGPSIIYSQGQYHAYFCSGGTGQQTEWDDVRHETSADLITWSAPDIIMKPVAVERSACDPSVVYFDAGDGPYYYLFYSGNILNVQTVNYVSRSKSPSGPFLKYTDRGTWEAAPADPHVITWPFKAAADGAPVYGAGEASVVVLNGVLYMWYASSDESGKPNGIYLTTSKNAIQWSAPVYTNVNDVSVDVKYDPTSQAFVMVEVTPQLNLDAQLQMRTSADGTNWSSAQIICDTNCLPNFSSNPGMSGDDQGHLIPGKQTLIGFGAPYNLSATTDSWGAWNLWGQLFNLTVSNPGAPVSSSPTIIPPGNVLGNVDSAVLNSDGTALIKGWACAIYDPNSIQVALYLGSSSAVGIGWFPASNASEGAIATACQASGQAYRYAITLTAGQVAQYGGQPIHLYGISPWGLGNLELANPNQVTVPRAVASAPAATSTGSTSTAVVYPPVASHDVKGIFGVDANGVIDGWACVTGLSDSISVHFYIGGPAGSGTFAVATQANLSNEQAVSDQCSATGNFRFKIVMDANFRNAFRGKTIYIHGISSVGGANSLLANSGSLVVP